MIDASQTDFSLTLIDKEGKSKFIQLDSQDLSLFPVFEKGFSYNKKNVLKWNYDDFPYEAFTHVLRPLCKELKTFNDLRLDVTQKEIIQSSDLLKDTKNVLEWIEKEAKQEENNGTINDFTNYVFQAYYVVNFLQLPFGIKRGIVNYLYDMGVADQIIDASDLATNASEWLISNREFVPLYPAIHVQEYRVLDFAAKQFRFFDGIKAIQDVQKIVQYQFFLCFDFQYNKIQYIDLARLLEALHPMFRAKAEGLPIFDFRQNPLSEETKNVIKQLGQEKYVKSFEVGFDEQIARFNKSMDQEEQALRDNVILNSSNSRKFRFLSGAISLAGFGAAYLVSSKILLQSMRKSLVHGFGSLLLISSIILYLYKNKKTLFSAVLSDQAIRRKKFLINNYNEQIEKLRKYKENSTLNFKSFLVDNLFYILYSE